MVWDEVSHLKGGLLLSRGQISEWAFTNSFYPPVYDSFVAMSFLAFGASVFSARLVSVVFLVLTVFVIYGISNLLYNSKKAALLSAVLFAVMPGVVWLSKLAMIETLLVFVVSLSMFFFFRWLQTNSKKDQTLGIIAFIVGVLVKYQVLVIVPIIMLIGTFFLKKDYFKAELKKWFTMPKLAVVITASIAALSILAILIITGTLDFLIYAFGTGSQQKAVYSTRYPIPIFYLIEMTWFTDILHPVSVLLYLVSLAGLAFMVHRRKTGDKYLLLWFSVVYIVFTLVPNREWRYLSVAFPVLAIAASSLVMSVWVKLRQFGQTAHSSLHKWGAKIGAASLIVLVAGGVYVSCSDAYVWLAQDQIVVPVEQASFYAGNGLAPNQTLIVVAGVNHFNKYMVSFCLSTKNTSRDFNDTCQQYPAAAMDTFATTFNKSELVGMCQANNTKYVLLFEYGKDLPYFQSDLTASKVYKLLNATGTFTLKETFGAEPNRVFIFEFHTQP
ncbi:MAG TPA: glycosyltransferase family 39 protein [Candidatus Acidoferrales bacterium]|nr:glycosyltransferase family 39 protein [Candidatus Acidoferrales bacterium]